MTQELPNQVLQTQRDAVRRALERFNSGVAEKHKGSLESDKDRK